MAYSIAASRVISLRGPGNAMVLDGGFECFPGHLCPSSHAARLPSDTEAILDSPHSTQTLFISMRSLVRMGVRLNRSAGCGIWSRLDIADTIVNRFGRIVMNTARIGAS